MALLEKETRKKYFERLGLGEYNEANIKKLQRKYLRKKDVDGVYGKDTDILLRHVYNVLVWLPNNNGGKSNFKPEEFKCECGGKYCTGYPSYMKRVELANLQSIRNHYKRPMEITCGLRCREYNRRLSGSIPNSLHLVGRACDFNMNGVTESIAQRKAAIKWIKKLPNHHYSYGHGYNSYGVSISAPYMGYGDGAAIHTDTSYDADPKVLMELTDLQKAILKACAVQTKYQKNAKYGWGGGAWLIKSKREATCVTTEGCILQRAKVLLPGGYLWHDIKGKVTHLRKNLKAIYPDKKLKALKNVIEPGDVVMVGNKHDVGAGSHVFIASGKWQGDYPIVWDHKSAYRYKDGKKSGEHIYKDHEECFAIVHPISEVAK